MNSTGWFALSELVEQVPDFHRLGLVDTVLRGPFQEKRSLGVHLGLDLLAHRAAQKVSPAKRVSRHFLRDLHHLFLIDDDALRLVQNVVDRRVQRVALGQTVFDLAILRNVLHRAGTVERHQRYDILDAGRFHAPQRIHHSGRFHLEDGDRAGGGVQFVAGLVVQRDRIDVVHCPRRRFIQLTAVGGKVNVPSLFADQAHRIGDLRQRFQAKEVELHQTGLFDPFHVELRRRHIRPRVFIKWHQRVQRTVPDHHTCGMGRGISQQPLQFLGIIQQARSRPYLP